MMTQDSLRFYKSHAVYKDFKGIVLDREEGQAIAKALGDGKAAILQNHGLLTVGHSSLGGLLRDCKSLSVDRLAVR